jgi:hypothetical protein
MEGPLFQCTSLHVTERNIHSVRVCHLSVFSLPSLVELEKIRDVIARMLEANKMMLYAEHITDVEFPSVEHFKLIISILFDSKSLIERQLIGTIIQTKRLDNVTKLARDTFFALYKPKKPLAITEATEESVQFIKDMF